MLIFSVTVEVCVGREDDADCRDSMLEKLPQIAVGMLDSDPHDGASMREGRPTISWI